LSTAGQRFHVASEHALNCHPPHRLARPAGVDGGAAMRQKNCHLDEIKTGPFFASGFARYVQKCSAAISIANAIHFR